MYIRWVYTWRRVLPAWTASRRAQHAIRSPCAPIRQSATFARNDEAVDGRHRSSELDAAARGNRLRTRRPDPARVPAMPCRHAVRQGPRCRHRSRATLYRACSATRRRPGRDRRAFVVPRSAARPAHAAARRRPDRTTARQLRRTSSAIPGADAARIFPRAAAMGTRRRRAVGRSPPAGVKFRRGYWDSRFTRSGAREFTEDAVHRFRPPGWRRIARVGPTARRAEPTP